MGSGPSKAGSDPSKAGSGPSKAPQQYNINSNENTSAFPLNPNAKAAKQKAIQNAMVNSEDARISNARTTVKALTNAADKRKNDPTVSPEDKRLNQLRIINASQALKALMNHQKVIQGGKRKITRKQKRKQSRRRR